MKYQKINLNGINIHISEDDISNLRLLQSSSGKAKLSQLRIGKDVPGAIINCSYFAPTFVLGRNQGDVAQATSSFTEQGYLGFAVGSDLNYKCGELDYWDVEQSVCGFTPATISKINGKDVTMASTSFVTYNQKMNLATGVSMFAVLDDKKTCLLITAEKGISGYSLAKYIKQLYSVDFLCTLDGGGSTEHIVNGSIVQKSTDGFERLMYNGLAFVKEKEEDMDFTFMYPCAEGWDSQANHDGGACDIGWLKEYSSNGHTDIYAAADGVVEYEGYYKQSYGGKTYNTICVIMRHSDLMKTKDVITIYWHLSSTCVDKGQVLKRGDKLGLKGNTGNSKGVHLHFQSMLIDKGAEVPTNYDGNGWRDISFYPVPFMKVYPGCAFKSVGNFTLENYIPTVEETDNDEIKALKDEIEKLKQDIADNKKLREMAENSLVEEIDKNAKLNMIIENIRLAIGEVIS